MIYVKNVRVITDLEVHATQVLVVQHTQAQGDLVMQAQGDHNIVVQMGLCMMVQMDQHILAQADLAMRDLGDLATPAQEEPA